MKTKTIKPEKFYQMITEFLYLKERKYFGVIPDLSVDYTPFGPTIKLTIELESVIQGETIRVPLDEDTIREMFTNYAKNHNCSFQAFLYVGGVRQRGYLIDEDTPYFEGVELYLNELTKGKNECLQKK